jgi:hypothetical protein
MRLRRFFARRIFDQMLNPSTSESQALTSGFACEFDPRLIRCAFIPETRSMSQAKLWLYWSTPERLTFLRGFVVAYRPALLRGCEFALDQLKSSSPKAEQTLADTSVCFKQEEAFDKPVEYYEQLMTNFYKQYPDDDDVPLKFLLLELAAHRSPNDIHNSLSPRGR